MNDWRSSDLSGALENGRTCSKLDSWILFNNRIQRLQTCKQYKRNLQEQNHSNWKEPRIERPFKLYTMQENAAAIVRIKATAPFICCVRKQIQFISMYFCVYIFCIYMYIHVYIHTYVYINIQTFIYANIHICLCITSFLRSVYITSSPSSLLLNC